jgi:hypothetical protein
MKSLKRISNIGRNRMEIGWWMMDRKRLKRKHIILNHILDENYEHKQTRKYLGLYKVFKIIIL